MAFYRTHHRLFLWLHTGQKSEEKPGYQPIIIIIVITIYFLGSFLYARYQGMEYLNTQNFYGEETIIITILQIRKMRPRY